MAWLFMTPAVVAAEKAGIRYELHEYPHNPAAASYGEEAARLLNVSPDRVFKMLIVTISNKPDLAVAIVPVSHSLNLKSIASFFAVKKVVMADATSAENATGYILGGISPLGQKKRLPCVLDASAFDFATIFVSGGKRSLEIELAAPDLIRLCDARTANIRDN